MNSVSGINVAQLPEERFDRTAMIAGQDEVVRLRQNLKYFPKFFTELIRLPSKKRSVCAARSTVAHKGNAKAFILVQKIFIAVH